MSVVDSNARLGYSTVRWMERHHSRRVIQRSVANVSKQQLLRTMFDDIDIDESMAITLGEINEAVQIVNVLNPNLHFERRA